MKIEEITAEEAQVYLWFEHHIMGKSYKQISQETGISKTTVGEIINGKYKRLYKNTEIRLYQWKQKYKEDLKKRQKTRHIIYFKNEYEKPSLWQRILKFLIDRK